MTYDVGEQKLSVTIAARPRADFTAFLRRGFEAYGHEAHADALDSLLALAEEVP